MTAHATNPADCDRLFGERTNAGDVEGLVALYEPTGALVREDGTAAVGPNALREDLTALLAMKPRITMNVTRVITAGDVAVLYNSWSLTAADPQGNSISLKGGAMEIVRRQADGTWRYVIDDPYAQSRG